MSKNSVLLFKLLIIYSKNMHYYLFRHIALSLEGLAEAFIPFLKVVFPF